MAGRGELTEEAWNAIAPLLPSSSGRRGGRWRDHGTVITGRVVETADRSALARPTRTLRAVAELRGSALPQASGWDLGPDSGAGERGHGDGSQDPGTSHE